MSGEETTQQTKTYLWRKSVKDNFSVNRSSITVRSRENRENHSPGARPAAAEPLRLGWGNSGEGNAGTTGDIVDMRGAPLGMNSVAAGLGACTRKKAQSCITTM